MNSLRCRCLLSSFLLLASLAAPAARAEGPVWAPIGPPASYGVVRLTAAPGDASTFYLETISSGTWKSTDAGATWQVIVAGLPAAPSAFAADPSNPDVLYAGVDRPPAVQPGLFRSGDGGATWTRLPAAPDTGERLEPQIDVDPAGTVYWVAHQTPYRSRDGGVTWDCLGPPVGCGSSSPGVQDLAVAPDRAGTVYVLTQVSRLLRSTDGGATWEGPFQIPFVSPWATRLAAAAGDLLYAWNAGGGNPGAGSPCLARSDDGGRTWKSFLDDRQCGAPAFDPRFPSVVRLLVEPGHVVLTSRDRGETWHETGKAPQAGTLLPDPSDPHGVLLGGTERLLRSHDGGKTWTPVGGGLQTAGVPLLVPSPEGEGTVYANILPTLTPNGTPGWKALRKTTDLGLTWKTLPIERVTALAIDPRDPRHLLAARLVDSDSGALTKIAESRDGGDSWTDISSPLPRVTDFNGDPIVNQMSWDPAKPLRVLATTFAAGVIASDNGGKTWHAADKKIPIAKSCPSPDQGCPRNTASELTRDPFDSKFVYIVFESSIYRSEDRGESWTAIGQGLLLAHHTVALAADPVVPGWIFGGTVPGSVYGSPDRGHRWAKVAKLPEIVDASGGKIAAPVRDLVVNAAGLFAAVEGLGVLRSADCGCKWDVVSDGIPFADVLRLAADPNDAATSGRLFATTPANGAFTTLFGDQFETLRP
jgi:photosystem II stability/assembly factor-like uncharacterized protein